MELFRVLVLATFLEEVRSSDVVYLWPECFSAVSPAGLTMIHDGTYILGMISSWDEIPFGGGIVELGLRAGL